MKGMDAGDLNKLAPLNGISGVTPTNQNRLIPRHGQPLTPQTPEKPNVPIEFQKLFSVEDEQEQLR